MLYTEIRPIYGEIGTAQQRSFETKEVLNMGWNKRNRGGGHHEGLPSSLFGGAPLAAQVQQKRKSIEVLFNGRRGRVLEDRDDALLVEFYATGDQELVQRSEAELSERVR